MKDLYKLFIIIIIFYSSLAYTLDSKYGQYEELIFPDNIEKKLQYSNSRNVAGREVVYRFVKKKLTLSKYPGKAIEGMAWMEILYNAMIKNPQTIQEDSIKGMWETRTNMRESMGFDKNLSTQEAMDRYLVLSKILSKATVTKQKISPGLKKRKVLLKDFKQQLNKTKKKYLENSDEDVILSNEENLNATKYDTIQKKQQISKIEPSKSISSSTKERLIELNELLNLGLITKEEHQTKKMEILDEL